ncbi:MAG: VOC family protein [Brevibacterium yomogidense]
MDPIVPNIWHDRTAVEASAFYTSAFREARETARSHYPTEGLQDFQKSFAGEVVTIDLEIHGRPLALINADDTFRPNPSAGFMLHFSPQIADDPHAYLDEVHDRLAVGATTLMPLDEYPFSARYAWIEDRYGVSWQLFLTEQDAPARPFLVPALMFCGTAQNRAAEAVAAYTSLYPGSEVGTVATYPEQTGPAAAGSTMYSDFRLGPGSDDPRADEWLTAMDSGVEQPFTFTEGFSLMVRADGQDDLDRLWSVLSTDPSAEQCGWCRDEFGVSWQVVPRDLEDLMARPGAYARLMEMKKIDIAALRGETALPTDHPD